ncbi:Protein LNK3, partial [Mucuna pruriens]
MDWYYGCGNSDFLVPKYEEDLLERQPSPDSWSEWGISKPEGFDSPRECLIMDTDEAEVEFNFIHESFSNEIEFDPSLYDKDQSSSTSSSACGGLPEQPFQQTPRSCDHQPKYHLQDLSTFEHMDDIFLDSVLEDFPCVESLHKSLFYPENQCSNTTGDHNILVSEKFFPSGGVQKDIADSEFVPCNSDCKDFLDIEAVKVLDPIEQSNGDETMHEQFSLEEFTLQGFEMLIAKFTEKTRICIRDALYRLARNTKQHVVENQDGDLDMHQAMPDTVYNETMRSEDNKPMESETNSVDRAIANLMFNKMEVNMLDLPFTTQVNLKQELPAEAEVPRFGPKNQQENLEPYIFWFTCIQGLAVSIQIRFDFDRNSASVNLSENLGSGF